jgi:hypothetical protein
MALNFLTVKQAAGTRRFLHVSRCVDRHRFDVEIKVFLLFLLVDGRIRIRIHTVPRLTYPDPEHSLKVYGTGQDPPIQYTCTRRLLIRYGMLGTGVKYTFAIVADYYIVCVCRAQARLEPV